MIVELADRVRQVLSLKHAKDWMELVGEQRVPRIGRGGIGKEFSVVPILASTFESRQLIDFQSGLRKTLMDAGCNIPGEVYFYGGVELYENHGIVVSRLRLGSLVLSSKDWDERSVLVTLYPTVTSARAAIIYKELADRDLVQEPQPRLIKLVEGLIERDDVSQYWVGKDPFANLTFNIPIAVHEQRLPIIWSDRNQESVKSNLGLIELSNRYYRAHLDSENDLVVDMRLVRRGGRSKASFGYHPLARPLEVVSSYDRPFLITEDGRLNAVRAFVRDLDELLPKSSHEISAREEIIAIAKRLAVLGVEYIADGDFAYYIQNLMRGSFKYGTNPEVYHPSQEHISGDLRMKLTVDEARAII